MKQNTIFKEESIYIFVSNPTLLQRAISWVRLGVDLGLVVVTAVAFER